MNQTDPFKDLPITIDPEIVSGTPVFRGTRVPIQTLFDNINDDYTLDQFLDDFPSVKRKDVIAVQETCRSFSLPKPYRGQKEIGAIVLGADPSNPRGKTFTHVFGIGDGDRRYFLAVEKNLKAIGLSLEKVYVQNIVQNYCTQETDKNERWYEFAELWKSTLKRELSKLESNVPVLVTAEKIYYFLTNQIGTPRIQWSKFYREPFSIPLYSDFLGRKVFPFFRHYRYNLSKSEWRGYKTLIQIELEK